ncbi:MAG: PKD domain-containing protein [Acidimicrobiales bacterium]
MKASESHAPGALAYQMAYGDGSSDQNNVPTYCSSGPGSPASQTWQLSHSYTKAGTYRATVTVKANCTSDTVTLDVFITVS